MILWLAIVATTVAFFRSSQIAGWLMVPYLALVSFAAVLNFTIWRLNTWQRNSPVREFFNLHHLTGAALAA